MKLTANMLAMDKALVRQVRATGVLFVTHDNFGLFIKRAGKEGVDNYVGYWSLPGGGIEDGETAMQAAQREVLEEIGETPDGHLSLLDVGTNGFRTFKQGVVKKFTPTLNAEHSKFLWAPLKTPPRPLHPGVAATLAKLNTQGDVITGDAAPDNAMAFDRASLRHIDQDGRLHVALSHISKSNVGPYRGKEIPNYKDLGLDPDKIYQMYRDPAELEKGAKTFNNLPLLKKHQPVNSMKPAPELVVGSTGTDAAWVAPYLDNSLVVWVQDSIDGIMSDEVKELSSAYRYRADMTPGTVDGVKYDGVMRDIIGNHVALVPEGRAGNDVVVGDSKEKIDMKRVILKKRKPLSALPYITQGVLMAGLTPILAQDAAIDVRPLIKGLTAKTYKAQKAELIAGLKKLTKGKLAQDATLDDVVGLLDGLDNIAEEVEGMDEDTGAAGAVADPSDTDEAMDDDPLAFLAGKCSPEEVAKVRAMIDGTAMDEPEPFKGKPGEDADTIEKEKDNANKDVAKDADVDDKKDDKKAPPFGKDNKMGKDADTVTKPAMDAAIKLATKTATDTARKEAMALRQAEKDVAPYIGEIDGLAMDSAEAVYRHAFEALEHEVPDNVPASALPAILKLIPVPGSQKPKSSVMAMDAKATKSFHDRFPNAKRIAVMG